MQGLALKKKLLRSRKKFFLALAAVNTIYTLSNPFPTLLGRTAERLAKVFGGCPFFKKGKVLIPLDDF